MACMEQNKHREMTEQMDTESENERNQGNKRDRKEWGNKMDKDGGVIETCLILHLPERESEDRLPCCCCILSLGSSVKLCVCVSECVSSQAIKSERACTPHCVFWWRSPRSSSGKWASKQNWEEGTQEKQWQKKKKKPRRASPVPFSVSLIYAVCEHVCTQNTCSADGDLWVAQRQRDGRSKGREGWGRRGGAEGRKKAITFSALAYSLRHWGHHSFLSSM